VFTDTTTLYFEGRGATRGACVAKYALVTAPTDAISKFKTRKHFEIDEWRVVDIFSFGE